jgi:hypothetical protein
MKEIDGDEPSNEAIITYQETQGVRKQLQFFLFEFLQD